MRGLLLALAWLGGAGGLCSPVNGPVKRRAPLRLRANWRLSVQTVEPEAPVRLAEADGAAAALRRLQVQVVSARAQRQSGTARLTEAWPFTTDAGRRPLEWLRDCAGLGGWRVYWATPDGADSGDSRATAGVGAADVVRGSGAAPRGIYAGAALLPQGAAYLGGSRFDDRATVASEWSEFGGHAFILPLVTLEYVRRGGDESLGFACHVSEGDAAFKAALETIDKLIYLASIAALESPNDEPRTSHRASSPAVDEPSQPDWTKAVDAALLLIKSRKVTKLVLARRRTYNFDQPQDVPDAFDVVQALEVDGAARQRGFRFALEQPDGGPAFLGCSPELLFGVSASGAVRVDAVAGSRSRALGDASRDLELAAELTASAKDGLENAIVVDFVTEKFDGLAKRGVIAKTGARAASVEVLALSNVQHLRCVLTAQLAPAPLKRLQRARARRRRPWFAPLSTFFDARNSAPRHLLEALHPTPATAGLPVEASKREIGKAEPFDRGWYAGPFGSLGADEAQFCVAIRSALISPSQKAVFAFSGAGIVRLSSSFWKDSSTRKSMRERLCRTVPAVPVSKRLLGDEWNELNDKLRPIDAIVAAE